MRPSFAPPRGRSVTGPKTKAHEPRTLNDQSPAKAEIRPSGRLPLLLWIVGDDISHGLRIGCCVTAANSRSVWSLRPPVGWLRWQVSWLTGRCLVVQPSQFPSGW